MSYILEALKKSDQSRRQAEVPGIHTMQGVVADRRTSVWVIPVIVILLLVIIGLLYWLLTKDSMVSRLAPVAVKEVVVSQSLVSAAVHELNPSMQPAVVLSDSVPGDHRVVTVVETAPLINDKESFEDAGDTAEHRPVDPYGRVLWWDELPSSLRAELPYPKLDVHVYSKDVARRFILVDLSKYRESDELAIGAIVEAIVSDGVVLSYAGEQYKIRRP